MTENSTMTIWVVIWVVFMILWLVGGGFVCYEGPAFNGRHFIGYSLIPWVCVLILGLIMFGAVSGGPINQPVVIQQR